MMLLRIILAILAIFLSVPMQSCSNTSSSITVDYENLGIPLEGRYDGGRERTAWDIEIFDDKLFVASGDYDKNSGPIDLKYFDLTDHTWHDSGIVPDEQIERFFIIDDSLVAPGADPKDDWSLGNYYQYAGDQWQTHRMIPGGIHQFDMLKFEGNIFIGIGVVGGQFPAVKSADNGKTFTQVPFYRNGTLLDTMPEAKEDGSIPSAHIRVYDLFQLEDQLYALYYYNDGTNMERAFYKYTDGAFWFYADLSSDIKFKRISREVFTAKAEFKGKAYLSCGNLYTTEDFIYFKPVVLGDDLITSDLQVIKDKLYICTIQRLGDGECRTSIWCNATGHSNDYTQLFCFTFPSPAQCFKFQDGIFYFGMGDGMLSEYDETNGTILAVHYPVD